MAVWFVALALSGCANRGMQAPDDDPVRPASSRPGTVLDAGSRRSTGGVAVVVSTGGTAGASATAGTGGTDATGGATGTGGIGKFGRVARYRRRRGARRRGRAGACLSGGWDARLLHRWCVAHDGRSHH